MIIILEGPDGGGKTTLAEYLRDFHAFEYRHTGPPDTGRPVLQQYGFELFSALKDTENDYVFDRLHLGELVYGPIVRGHDQLGKIGLKLLNRVINSQGVIVVICLPHWELCFINWKKKPNDYVKDPIQFQQIYQAYVELAKQYRVYDYSKVEPEAAIAQLDWSYAKMAKLPLDLIGSTNARFLFVGEVANHPTLDFPFFATDNSSAYLNDSLADAGYTEREIAMTNALRLDGTPRDVFRLTKELAYAPIVVSLGKRAGAICKPCPRHTNLPHPAYWKRFHSTEQSRYVQQLREVRLAGYR